MACTTILTHVFFAVILKILISFLTFTHLLILHLLRDLATPLNFVYPELMFCWISCASKPATVSLRWTLAAPAAHRSKVPWLLPPLFRYRSSLWPQDVCHDVPTCHSSRHLYISGSWLPLPELYLFDDFDGTQIKEKSLSPFHVLSTRLASLCVGSSLDKEAPPFTSMVFQRVLINTDNMIFFVFVTPTFSLLFVVVPTS